MEVRCPQCNTPIELAEDSPLSDICCPSCGGSFSLLGEETVTYRPAQAKTIGRFELADQIGIGSYGSVWRARDTELPQEFEEALLACRRSVLAVHFGDGDDRVEARRREVAYAVENSHESALAANRIVRRRIVSIHRNAKVERVVGTLGQFLEPHAALRIE